MSTDDVKRIEAAKNAHTHVSTVNNREYDKDVSVEMVKLIGRHDKSIPMNEMRTSSGIVENSMAIYVNACAQRTHASKTTCL